MQAWHYFSQKHPRYIKNIVTILDTYFHEKPAKLTHLCGKCQIVSIARYS